MELLVVVALIAVLLAILLPVIGKVRVAALNTVCAARLHDLSLATLQFEQDQKALPLPPRNLSTPGLALAPLGEVVPHNVESRLLNDLHKYLKFPEVVPGATVHDLPESVVCPFVEADDARGPYLADVPASTYYYTGYAYVGRLDEAVAGKLPAPKLDLGLSGMLPLPPITLPSPTALTAVLLQPHRSARSHDSRRAVLWADDVHFGLDPQPHWQFAHARGPTDPGPLPHTYASTKGLLGQHRAYSDGSVEWVAAADLHLQPAALPASPAPSLLDLTATFKLSGSFYWWY